MHSPKAAGFTLVESLIALAILAIAMAAIARASGSNTLHVDALRTRILADWVAENRLALHSARGDWLPVGVQSGEEIQAGGRYLWKEEISSTPNPAFRRIDISVSPPGEPELVVRKLTGFLVSAARQ
ncbi:MAG TPA: type II secretion system minor pseudopilin GspI [Gallionellaceae bacterium]